MDALGPSDPCEQQVASAGGMEGGGTWLLCSVSTLVLGRSIGSLDALGPHHRMLSVHPSLRRNHLRPVKMPGSDGSPTAPSVTQGPEDVTKWPEDVTARPDVTQRLVIYR